MSRIDSSARVVGSEIGSSEVREYVTVHDSTIGDDCRLYERTSIKKSELGDSIDVNSGSYVENATIEPRVQIGPNSTVAGVTHELSERGMEFGNDRFEDVRLGEGVFVGAGVVVGPGVEIGTDSVIAAGGTVVEDVEPERIVLGSPPTQRRLPLDEWVE